MITVSSTASTHTSVAHAATTDPAGAFVAVVGGRVIGAAEAVRRERLWCLSLLTVAPGTQSAGGMPDRVKCLHALAAHELAVPGTNPLGAEAVRAAGEWWHAGPCVPPGEHQ